MTRYWFVTKRYGWGWTPATWEGWLVLAAFLGVTYANWYRLRPLLETDPKTAVAFTLETVVLVVALIVICYKKGEKPRWRWGGK